MDPKHIRMLKQCFCLGKVSWWPAIGAAAVRLRMWKNLAITNGMRVSESSATNETKIKGAARCREE